MVDTLRTSARLARRALLMTLAIPLLLPAQAQAQASSRPIKIVVPFAAGGGQDNIARYLATELATRLGTTVIVENKAGAGGVIAADAVAKASADGTTLLMATAGAISIAPHLLSKLPYSPQQDLVPVAMVADTPMVLAVRTQSPYRTLAEFVRAAKEQPGLVTYASTGSGTVSHLTGELLAQGTGIQLIHVPYRGAAPAVVDLVSGQVAAIVTSAGSLDTMIEGGKVRVLASFSATPLAGLSGVPTVQQALSAPGYAVPVWAGLMAPAKTPRAVVDRISTELVAICRLPQTQKHMRDTGVEPACAPGAEFGKVIADDTQRWQQVARSGNIKLD